MSQATIESTIFAAAETAKQPRPLDGIRIVDFTHWVVGPIAGKMLAVQGAEVIKVERTDSYDGARRMVLNATGAITPNSSGMFSNFNADKLSVTLNTRHPEGLEIAKKLIAASDAVVENFSAGVLDSWGLGWEEMRALNPALVYVSLSGFGHTGPDKDYRSYGPTAAARSGLTFTSGLPGKAPAGWGFSYMDIMGGFIGSLALSMGIYQAKQTGVGQHIDYSIIEASMTMLGTFFLDAEVNGRPTRRPGFPPGNRDTFQQFAPHNTYRCAGLDRAGQDQWCFIRCDSDAEFAALCQVIERPELACDERFATLEGRIANQDELDAIITEWTSVFSKHYVMAKCQEAGITAGAVQNSEDKMDFDPQLIHREVFPAVSHPEIGTYRYEGFPVKLSRTPITITRGGPLYAEHNEYVYGEILGYSSDEIRRLEAEGVIRAAD